MLAAALILLNPSMYLPAFTGYLVGTDSTDRSDDGPVVLQSAKGSVLWGGYISNPGALTVKIRKGRETSSLGQIEVKGTKFRALINGDKGTFEVKNSGWYTFSFSQPSAFSNGVGSVETSKPSVQVLGLELEGSAVEGAKFNLKTRRNAASVHIGYPQANGQEVEWFYNEIQAKTDPLNSYYMACGFSRGYFGMQVNSGTERRVIFSVWDAGNEAVDRNKVSDDNKVRLLAKGTQVVADSFGNEGTGGHSHLVTAWRTNAPQRFLVHAKKDGTGTIYTGYYMASNQKVWKLIASFRAPKDGNLLRGLYSFNENFWGDNGHLKRAAEFGPAWIKSKSGEWQQLSTGRFTHDATGKSDRFDYDLTTKGKKWLLQNGGFEGITPKFGTLVEILERSQPPAIEFEALPK